MKGARSFFIVVTLILDVGVGVPTALAAEPGVQYSAASSVQDTNSKAERKAQRKAARKQARAKRNAELKQLQNEGYNPGATNDQDYPQGLDNPQKPTVPRTTPAIKR